MKAILFTAPGFCQPCASLKRSGTFEKFASKYPDREIEVVDLSDEDDKKAQARADKYHVRGVPSLIFVNSAGKKIAEADGFANLRALEAAWDEVSK